MSKTYIYVDGSAKDNVNVTAATPAGWGFVVVEGDPGPKHDKGKMVKIATGPVQTDPTKPDYIGALVGSNNTGELSAIYWALVYADRLRPDSEVEIRGDSMYAGKMATGEWRPKSNQKLVQNVRDRWLTSVCELTWSHVRAHRGYKWNEEADQLAKLGWQ